jgi:hypothetical protein
VVDVHADVGELDRVALDQHVRRGAAHLGLYPIVTSQYISTTSYQTFICHTQ